MSIEQQRTFGEIVGMEPKMPVGSHRDDWVFCSDDSLCRLENAFADCNGNHHSNEEDCLESNVTILTEFLDGVVKWSEEYATENTDYADGYCHLVDEGSHDWPDRIDEWLERNFADRCGHSKYDDCKKELIQAICEELDGKWDCEPEYCGNEYSSYSGKACCLDSFEVGECEEQLSIADHPILRILHDQGTLDDCLDQYNGDGHISRDRRRVKNEETGCYERVGRETYDPYGSDYPDVMLYTNPGGKWDFVVSEERMNELLISAIITVCRKGV